MRKLREAKELEREIQARYTELERQVERDTSPAAGERDSSPAAGSPAAACRQQRQHSPPAPAQPAAPAAPAAAPAAASAAAPAAAAAAPASAAASAQGVQGVQARAAALRSEAVELSRQGRKQEALLKLREAKQLEAEAAGSPPSPSPPAGSTGGGSGGGGAASSSSGGGGGSGAAGGVTSGAAAARVARREVAHPDLALNEMEAELVSAKIAEAEGGISSGTPALYAVFSWEMPGAQPQTFRTEAAKPALTPEWRHKARLSFERGKSATRFFERRKCALEVWAAARGIGTWFGAEDELLGRAEFRISTLLSQATWREELPLRRVTAEGETVTLGFVKVQLRLRTALEAQGDASPPKAPPKAAPKAAAAAEEEAEDDSDFANAIVSYNVLEWELGRLNEQVAAMQAKGAIVPFAYGSRQEALIFRRDFMQIQVQTGLLSMASYLQQLRDAIPQEVARAKAFKAQDQERRAVQHLKRAKIMKAELEEALQSQG